LIIVKGSGALARKWRPVMPDATKPKARAGKASAAEKKAADISDAVLEFINDVGVEAPIEHILDNLYLMFDGIGSNQDRFALPDQLLPHYLTIEPTLVRDSVFYAKETVKFLIKLNDIASW